METYVLDTYKLFVVFCYFKWLTYRQSVHLIEGYAKLRFVDQGLIHWFQLSGNPKHSFTINGPSKVNVRAASKVLLLILFIVQAATGENIQILISTIEVLYP